MKPVSIIIIASFLLLVVSFWNRNELPRDIAILPALSDEPRQAATRMSAFDAVFNDVTYRVEPEYEYELHGMIVSFRHHDGKSRMHLQANDHLNMLDVCVVWGSNAANPLIHQLEFWNGIFTCMVSTRDQEAWNSFDMFQLSNNHLISDDPFIRDQVKKISIGDQIRFRGYLASYSNDQGGKRGTSTTRLDTGDGACETVYVEQFEILQPARSGWRISMYGSLGVFLFATIVHFRRPYRPYRNAD